MEMRLERKANSLISRGEVFGGNIYRPRCATSLFPQMALSPVAFAGWSTASELTDVGDFV